MSCVNYYYTDDGGIRVINPKVFKYNKDIYTLRDKTGIDTNAIYLIDSSYNVRDTPKWRKQSNAFIRFFSTGQVLFIYSDSILSISEINNENIGIPGYFIAQDNKVKIDMFQNLNGGQTGRYYGRVLSNGDLMFYSERPELYFNSFKLLEKAEREKRFTIWRKTKVENLKYYTPNW